MSAVVVKKKKPKAEIPVKKKRKPKEPSAVEQMFEVTIETFQRLAPDEITVFANRVHTVNTTTDEHYWTHIGQAQRVNKESGRALQHFREQAADILHLLRAKDVTVQRYEFEEVPFCAKHS